MKAFLTNLALAVFVSGCSFLGTGGGSGDAYTYKAFDSTGILVAEGTLTIDFVPGEDEGEVLIRGERRISLVVDSALVGPQLGRSDIEGEVDDGFVYISLTPEARPNGLQLGEEVVLRGPISADRAEIQGSWMYTKTEGPTRQLASGTFEASRQ